MLTLCLGDALVDLVCQRPVTSLAEADAFVPHFGGATANVAVGAARHGGTVALAGGAGDDEWGDWLHHRLAAEGVDLRWFALVEGLRTPLAFVTVDATGEPAFRLYGDGIAAMLQAVGDRLLEAVEEAGAFCFGSNALVDEQEAELTLTARERALELEHPVVFDPNLRLGRWGANPARAATSARECVRDSFLVKCNEEEARLLTGEGDPRAAAESLLAGGARNVVVTLGERGAILRGEGVRRDVPGRRARMVNATGAGDAFLGVLLAHLGRTDYYPPALAAALPEAAEEATRACERWGALE